MKWISFALIISLLFGFQQRPVVELFVGSMNSGHSHENPEPSLVEMVEILLTGNLVHTHSHEEHEGDSHSHSHQHNFNSNIPSVIFVLTDVHFSFPTLKQGWELKVKMLILSHYYSEILRPPIKA